MVFIETFMVDVAANYRKVLERINEAAAKCGRDPNGIRVLAASKSQSISQIRAAIEAGVRLFGENYLQEARAKGKAIKESVEWHMIGHLQRNKVKAAVGLFCLIQSLDSLELARELDKQGRKREQRVRVFVEVNLGGEESKSGIAKDRVASLLQEVGTLTHLSVEGLMAVPPFRENPDEVRPYFRALRELQMELQGLKIPNVDLKELSMGMTHDYPVAIEEGATLVRIGTAIFGPRES
ncbi:MAG: YggS family pyridoxal phosphate-dependent enzyme [Candidatus Binatia bacterium]